jgi:hypothetical protein
MTVSPQNSAQPMSPEQKALVLSLCNRLLTEQEPDHWEFYRATLAELLAGIYGEPHSA